MGVGELIRRVYITNPLFFEERDHESGPTHIIRPNSQNMREAHYHTRNLAISHFPLSLSNCLLTVNTRPIPLRNQPAMSYVPPHLRNSSAAATSLLNGNSDHFQKRQLNTSYSEFTSAKSNGNSNNLSTAGYRSSGHYVSSVPEPVSPQWKPSDRVIRLKPEQVLNSAPFSFRLNDELRTGFIYVFRVF